MYIKQMLILVAIAFVGSEIASILQLPVPATVIGLILLFIALLTKIIKRKDVEESAMFIVDNLSIFYVVPTVALTMYFDILSSQLVQILVPLLVSMLCGMFVAGKVTELTIRLMQKRYGAVTEGAQGAGKGEEWKE